MKKTIKHWARARAMGGGNFMAFSWHDSEDECRAECVRRKEESQTSVNFFPIYLPDGYESEEECQT